MYREKEALKTKCCRKPSTFNMHLLNTTYSSTAITNKYDHLLDWNSCWNLACKFPECCSFALEKGKEVGGLLKPFENWAQGDEFLSLGTRYNWFSAQWLTGVTFNTPNRRRMEMYPKVQLLLQISTYSASSPEEGCISWEGAGGGASPSCGSVLTEAPAPWHSDFQWPGAKSTSFPTWIPRWGESAGQTHHEIHINIITTLSESTVAMSTKQLGKLGLWEIGKWGWLWQHGPGFLLTEQSTVSPAGLFLPSFSFPWLFENREATCLMTLYNWELGSFCVT